MLLKDVYFVFYSKVLATYGVPRTLVFDTVFGKINQRILKICQETWGFSLNCILPSLAFHPNFPCSFAYQGKKIVISPFEFFKYATLWDNFAFVYPLCLENMFSPFFSFLSLPFPLLSSFNFVHYFLDTRNGFWFLSKIERISLK